MLILVSMKKNAFWFVLGFIFCSFGAYSQGGSAFGIKAGPLAGFQSWNNSESELLFRYHGVAYIESYSPDGGASLFAQAGYHVRGGALRLRGGAFQAINSSRIINIPTQSYPYEFRNVSLSLGAKQRFSSNDQGTFYYLLGVRGEYTINTNLEDYHPENDPLVEFNLIHPFPGSNVRRWNYGITAGGGYEFMFSELVGGLVELSISPDLSQQYFQNAFTYTSNINGQSQRTIGERRIRNISIELSVGFRFLRIVEYIDDVF